MRRDSHPAVRALLVEHVGNLVLPAANCCGRRPSHVGQVGTDKTPFPSKFPSTTTATAMMKENGTAVLEGRTMSDDTYSDVISYHGGKIGALRKHGKSSRQKDVTSYIPKLVIKTYVEFRASACLLRTKLVIMSYRAEQPIESPRRRLKGDGLADTRRADVA